MSEYVHRGDLHIPAALSGSGPIRSSYRAHRPGMDRGTRYMLFAATALGGLLLAGMGGWALMGSRDAPVPVIEADMRPLRVKPENAGGLQVVGAEDQVMGGQGATTRGMAPAAEAPAPQALRAQMQPTPAAPVPVAPAAPAAVVTPLETAAVAASAPPQAAAAPPRPAVAATRPAVLPAGATLVQLAAVDTEQAAQAEWQRLAKRLPELLGDRRPVVQRADREGRTVWRVRTGGFADIAEATGFCTRVRAKGGACSIASF